MGILLLHLPPPFPVTAFQRPLLRGIASAVLSLGVLACGAPDEAAAPRASADSVPTRDSAARAEPAGAGAFDTTNYFETTAESDPDSVVRGRVAGSTVLDSVSLGRGAVAVLVRLGPGRSRDYGYFRVYVAEPSDSGRAARATNLEVLGTVPPGQDGFGATDVDGDGRRDPYLAGWTGGNAGYIVSLNVVDRRARRGYWYELYGEWSYLPRRGEFQGDPLPAAPMRRWMASHAERVADVADPAARDPVVQRHHAEQRQWERDHGPDFVQGPVRVRWYAGRPPLGWQPRCRTREGDLEWLHEGSVWGYDRARDRHFLLYDFGRFDYPHGVVTGVRYLWMGTVARTSGGYGVLAYDRPHRRVTVIPVPELGRAIPLACDSDRCGGPSLSVRHGRLYGDTVPLTLPDSIVPRVEFPDTGRVCTAPG